MAEPLAIISDDELERKKEAFVDKLSTVDRIELERDTRDQNQSSRWHQERKCRITASKFGDICKMKPHTSCKKKVHQILYNPSTKTKEMNYGIEFEPIARDELKKKNVQFFCNTLWFNC